MVQHSNNEFGVKVNNEEKMWRYKNLIWKRRKVKDNFKNKLVFSHYGSVR